MHHAPMPARGDEADAGSFDFRPATRLLFGPGRIVEIGSIARELGGQRILVVTDPGIVAAGHADRVEQILLDAGLIVTRFDQVKENPSTRCVELCLEVAHEARIDLFVGLGGGSSMDTAKGCNFLYTNGGTMRDYWGVGKATQPMKPLIAVPTTAGTGSECQSAALIADENTHQKMACLDPKAAARVAVLDPALTLSQPARVTACTGMDAIAHAVETAVTTRRNALSQMFSARAFQLCVPSLPLVLQDPNHLQARGQMLLGAAFAGWAIENSMLGAAHSAANPLTAHFDLTHGTAVGLMLPHVIRLNASHPGAARTYAELAAGADLGTAPGDIPAGVEALVARIEALLNAAQMPRSLEQAGVTESDLPALAEEAAQQWTARFNPIAVRSSDFLALFRRALTPRGDGDRLAPQAPSAR
jgi:alcohol dehydrogenase